MIEAMRSTVAKWIIRVLAVFLILSFAVWGIGDVFRGRTTAGDVAEVGGVKITSRELNREFRSAVNNIRSRLGGQFDTQQAIKMGMVRQTLDGLIQERLMALETKRLGLDAGDDLIRRTIREDPGFQNQARRFDETVFREYLRRRELTEAGFVAELRERITRSQMEGAVIAGSSVPKSLSEVTYKFRNERRNGSVVLVSREPATKMADPNGAVLAEFHKKNAAAYTAPSYRDVTVVHLDPAVLAKEIRPAEKQLRGEYESRLAALSNPERRQIQQILVHDEALARKVHRLLTEGRSFTDTATQVAKVKVSNLDLGNLRKTELPAKLSEIAFGMEQGAVGAPVKTALGWHILHVVKIQAGSTPSFEKVRKRIAHDLSREQAVDALIEIANKFEDSLAGGTSLADAATQANATPRRINSIAANGNDPSGKKVADTPDDPRFLETVFSAEIGQISALLETQEGGFYMIRVEGVTPPTLRPLETVKKNVIAAWKIGQLNKASKRRAETLLADAKRLGSLDAAAKAMGLRVATGKPFTRFERDPTSPVPPTLVAALFRVKKDDMAMAAYQDGFAVGVLTDIEAARPEQNKKQYDEIRKTLRQSIEGDLLAQFSTALRMHYPVTVNDSAVDALF